jgi:hypothetical protein
MAGLAVQIVPTTTRVAPGGTANLTVSVANLGSVVERYTLSMVGIDPGWWTVAPASLELFPESGAARLDGKPTVGQFAISIHPPRLADARSGEWPIGVKVKSEHGDESLVEEGTLYVEPFSSVEGQLRPTLLSGRRGATTTVLLTNAGNKPETVDLRGSDPEDRLSISFVPVTAALEAGAKTRVQVRIGAGGGHLLGQTRVRPFVVEARPRGGSPPLAFNGTFRHRSLIPGWIPATAVAVIALALAGFATWAAFLSPKPTPAAAPAAEVGRPSATATPIVTIAPATAAPTTPPPAPTTPPPVPTTPPPAPPSAPPASEGPIASFYRLLPDDVYVWGGPPGANVEIYTDCTAAVGSGTLLGPLGGDYPVVHSQMINCGGTTGLWVGVYAAGYQPALKIFYQLAPKMEWKVSLNPL